MKSIELFKALPTDIIKHMIFPYVPSKPKVFCSSPMIAWYDRKFETHMLVERCRSIEEAYNILHDLREEDHYFDKCNVYVEFSVIFNPDHLLYQTRFLTLNGEKIEMTMDELNGLYQFVIPENDLVSYHEINKYKNEMIYTDITLNMGGFEYEYITTTRNLQKQKMCMAIDSYPSMWF
jgi:hypothetical protein